MTEQQAISDAMEQALADQGFTIVSRDMQRPWGGFFVIDEAQAAAFIDAWFTGYDTTLLTPGAKLSPKVLMVAPGKRLSWQYHHRRAELWRVILGPVAVAMSDTDEETERPVFEPGDIIALRQGQRHRLIGLDGWGVVAEIWQHSDADNPSDEDDIVRLQDDFGR